MYTYIPHAAMFPSSNESESTNASRPWLAQVGASAWKALCASGTSGARRQTLDFAAGCDTLQPSLAAELRAASARVSAR